MTLAHTFLTGKPDEDITEGQADILKRMRNQIKYKRDLHKSAFYLARSVVSPKSSNGKTKTLPWSKRIRDEKHLHDKLIDQYEIE